MVQKIEGVRKLKLSFYAQSLKCEVRLGCSDIDENNFRMISRIINWLA